MPEKSCPVCGQMYALQTPKKCSRCMYPIRALRCAPLSTVQRAKELNPVSGFGVGWFEIKTIKMRQYLYYRSRQGRRTSSRYVGKVSYG